MIQYIIIFFSLFAVYRAGLKLKDKTISKREFVWWSMFWLLVMVAVLMPKNLDKIAQKVGVERGADLAMYLAIVVIFYLVFRIYVRLDKLDKNITQIVRKIALNNNEDNRVETHCNASLQLDHEKSCDNND